MPTWPKPAAATRVSSSSIDGVAGTAPLPGDPPGSPACSTYQEGRNNNSVVYQNGVFPFLVRTSQQGADNRVFIQERMGGFGGPVVTQAGTGNRATIDHYDDYYSGISIDQAGLRNQADLVQTAAYMTDGMSVIQHGADNLATVFNTGTSNSLLVSQLGNNATAATYQSGNSNRGAVYQY